MPPREDIMDYIRHEERDGREIVYAAFEASISSPKDKWCDTLLDHRQPAVMMSNTYTRLTLSVAINDFSNR
jgi:hypothetical protein